MIERTFPTSWRDTMNGYTKWERRLLKVGFFSMTGLAMTAMLTGFVGVAVGHRAVVLAGAGGWAAAAAIGGATVITLQIMAGRGRRSWCR